MKAFRKHMFKVVNDFIMKSKTTTMNDVAGAVFLKIIDVETL